MVSEIEKIPVIKVVREDPHNNTLLYEGDADYEALKRDFYGKSGIKHWTGTW